MKKLVLTGITALFLATGIANAYNGDADEGTCYKVLETPDNFLAMRTYPTARSRIIWALRQEDDLIVRGPRFFDKEDFRWRKNWKTWIHVVARDDGELGHQGWVYKKYIKQVPCEVD